jgi:hypothetical protein
VQGLRFSGRISFFSSYFSEATTHNAYFADGNGNITYMLNASQAMVASYRYDPFGNLRGESGRGITPSS